MIYERVHISHGVSKLGADIPSISLPPVTTCRSDAPCFKGCYARKGRFSFQHNKDLLSKNYEIWCEAPAQYEQDIKFAAFHSRFFRYHSSGDIPDAKYLEMMVRIANDLPNTSFLCFTKKYEMVNEYLDINGHFPNNLRIVLSAWGNWLPDNPHSLPVAYIMFKKKENGEIPSCAKRCPKYCGDCVMSGCSCWDLQCGESVVFDEH